jgi:hypothetical protein
MYLKVLIIENWKFVEKRMQRRGAFMLCLINQLAIDTRQRVVDVNKNYI